MTPEDIIEPLMRHYTLPKSLWVRLYDLLKDEIRDGFPAMGEENPLGYAKGLLSILDRLPAVLSEADDGALASTIGQLTGFTQEDRDALSRLRKNIELLAHQKAGHIYETKINLIENWLDMPGKAAPEDERWAKRELKDYQKQLKEHQKDEELYTSPSLPVFWQHILNFNIGFGMPQKLRFQGTHVIAAPDAGKTVMLEYLLTQDVQTNASVIVIEPKGTLTDRIAGLKSVDPSRIVYVHPARELTLNIFDLDGPDSQVAELLNYVFAPESDEGAPTPMQEALLGHCCNLLRLYPRANLDTLYDLLQEKTLPEKFQRFLPRLTKASRDFFTKQFGGTGESSYQTSKRGLLWRIDRLRRDPNIERIFTGERTSIDMKDIMAGGKILLVNTSPRHTGNYGSKFLGRFIVALITLAGLQRDLDRPLRPVYVYLDEADLYLSDYARIIITKLREYKVGLTIAHQDLQDIRDISPQLEAAIHLTGIKVVGRVNESDAKTMAGKLRLPQEALAFQKAPHFAFYAHGFLDHPLTLKADYSYLQNLPRRSGKEIEALMPPYPTQETPPILKMAAEPESKYQHEGDSEVRGTWQDKSHGRKKT